MLPTTQNNPYFNLYPNQPSYSPSHNPVETYVTLNKTELSAVQFMINGKEKILYAGTMSKVSRNQSLQKRILVITNQNLYNIKPKKKSLFTFALCAPLSANLLVKRKVPINKIFAITLSTTPSEEFLLHVRGDYDYSFKGDKRTKVIQSILNANHINPQDPLYLFFKNEPSLTLYQTTNKDLQSKFFKPLSGDKIAVTPALAQQGFAWIYAKRRELINSNPSLSIQNYSASQCVPSGLFVSNEACYKIYPKPGSENSREPPSYVQSSRYNPPSFGDHFNRTNFVGGVSPPSYYVPEAQNQLSQFQPPGSSVNEISLSPHNNSEETKLQNDYVQPKIQVGNENVNQWNSISSQNFPGYTENELNWLKGYLSPSVNVQVDSNFEKYLKSKAEK